MDDHRYSEGRQDAQIDSLIRTTARIEATLEEMRKSIPLMIEEKIAPVRKAVLGNGSPRKGLIARIEWHDRMLKFLVGVISALFIASLVSQFAHV